MTSALTTTASVLPCCRQWVKMLFDDGVAVGTFLMSAGKHPKVPILFARFYLFCGLSLFFCHIYYFSFTGSGTAICENVTLSPKTSLKLHLRYFEAHAYIFENGAPAVVNIYIYVVCA